MTSSPPTTFNFETEPVVTWEAYNYDELDGGQEALLPRQGREEVDGGDPKPVQGVKEEGEEEAHLSQPEEEVLVEVLNGVEGCLL